ncbi:MAG: phenylalanine--tRNA ligase subunit alpha [Elusimicrobia bacterium]|nr:phenylalanine--tRNA ligase subunit alpha [Elusimicrobiota bacterium]
MEPTARAAWEQAYARVASVLREAGVEKAADLSQLEEIRVRFLGRKADLTELLKSLKDLPLDDKRELGPRAQELKAGLEAAIEARRATLEEAADAAALQKDAIDLTLPALHPPRGRLHPLTTTLHEISRIFQLMGYSWAEGPFVENDYHNFTALNIPEDHPARDSQDTFYLQGLPLLLRTHTSTVQIRTMESQRPPLRVVCPGRVFRHEQLDATHSAVFHQVEGLVIDENIGLADLKGHLQTFLAKLLGASTKTRFRPSYFPFTEPSTEVDVKCFFCPGAGCPSCKHTGWIEILGAGVVNPAVLKAVSYDAAKWSGFAFGIGVERVAMLLHGVRDLRDFYTNDLRFLKQFDENLV